MTSKIAARMIAAVCQSPYLAKRLGVFECESAVFRFEERFRHFPDSELSAGFGNRRLQLLGIMPPVVLDNFASL